MSSEQQTHYELLLHVHHVHAHAHHHVAHHDHAHVHHAHRRDHVFMLIMFMIISCSS